MGTERQTDPNVRPPVLRDVQAQIARRVIGRDREIELLLVAVAAGRDLLLEGPPGTSKTTILQAITEQWGIPLLFVEGNADLTASRLIGTHDPSRVLQEGYTADNFVPGPLVRAMLDGGFLYIEELNRAPEDTLNTLLGAMADRRAEVPRLGRVDARPTFRVVASMNPVDDVGTSRLSTSVHDRLCRLAIGYQDDASERAIVALRAVDHMPSQGSLGEHIVADAVAVTRATRERDEVRQGSSVRGAIDLALVAARLIDLRGLQTADDVGYTTMIYDAMLLALSGRIFLDESAGTTPERVLREIWEDHFFLDRAMAKPG